MAKYRAKVRAFINSVLYAPGEIFESSAPGNPRIVEAIAGAPMAEAEFPGPASWSLEKAAENAATIAPDKPWA